MPGVDEKQLIVRIAVRKSEKFLEVKNDFTTLGANYSAYQHVLQQLARDKLLSLQARSPAVDCAHP